METLRALQLTGLDLALCIGCALVFAALASDALRVVRND